MADFYCQLSGKIQSTLLICNKLMAVSTYTYMYEPVFVSYIGASPCSSNSCMFRHMHEGGVWQRVQASHTLTVDHAYREYCGHVLGQIKADII